MSAVHEHILPARQTFKYTGSERGFLPHGKTLRFGEVKPFAQGHLTNERQGGRSPFHSRSSSHIPFTNSQQLKLRNTSRTSLVVQWLRSGLPLQGTRLPCATEQLTLSAAAAEAPAPESPRSTAGGATGRRSQGSATKRSPWATVKTQYGPTLTNQLKYPSNLTTVDHTTSASTYMSASSFT